MALSDFTVKESKRSFLMYETLICFICLRDGMENCGMKEEIKSKFFEGEFMWLEDEWKHV